MNSARMRRILRLGSRLFPLAALLMVSCAAPQAPQAPRYESAEHKEIVLFLRAYQEAWNSRSEAAIMRLYGERSREVPLLMPNARALDRKSLAQALPDILKIQAKANLAQESMSPVAYKIAGDQASVAYVVKITYAQDDIVRTGYIRRTMYLARTSLFWKVEFSHFEFIAPDKTVEGLTPL